MMCFGSAFYVAFGVALVAGDVFYVAFYVALDWYWRRRHVPSGELAAITRPSFIEAVYVKIYQSQRVDR